MILAVVFVVAGLYVTLSEPVVKDVTVKIHSLPQDQEGFTIALLSDFHIGPTVGRKRIEKVVNITNALHPGHCCFRIIKLLLR